MVAREKTNRGLWGECFEELMLVLIVELHLLQKEEIKSFHNVA